MPSSFGPSHRDISSRLHDYDLPNSSVKLVLKTGVHDADYKRLSACSVGESSLPALAYHTRPFGQIPAYLSDTIQVILVRRIG